LFSTNNFIDGFYRYNTTLDTKLGKFSAGIKDIKIKKLFINGDFRYEIVSQSKITNSFIKNFYSVKDSIYMLIHPDDFALLSLTQITQEKNKPKKIYQSFIDYNSLKIDYTKIKDTTRTNHIIAFDDSSRLYDVLGIMFSFSQHSTIQLNDIFSFLHYRKKKITPIDLQVLDFDKVSVNDSLIECYLLSPVNPKNKELQIWINSVFPYTPIKIAKRIKQGILTMHLDSLIYEK
jgi:hypothetical protein